MQDSADPIFSKRSLEEIDKWSKPDDQKSKCSVIHMQGVQYCEETTLHGFQYLTHPGLATKIGWVVVVGLAIAASIYFMINNLTDYLHVRALF